MIHKSERPHQNPYELSKPKRWREKVRPEVKSFFKLISIEALELLRMYHAFSWFIDTRDFKYKWKSTDPDSRGNDYVEVSIYDPEGYGIDKAWHHNGLADYSLNPWPFFTVCASGKTQREAKWKLFKMYIRFNQMKSMERYIPEVLLGSRDNEIYDNMAK